MEPMGPGGGTDVQNVKTFCEFFRTGFRSSKRRQYFGSLLRELGVTLVAYNGDGPKRVSTVTPHERT